MTAPAGPGASHKRAAGPAAADANGNIVTASIVTRYSFKDRLGSIVLVRDKTGAALEQLSYDPWGKRRFVTWTDDPTGSIVGQQTNRGFTGHEELDSVALVHMNGRIYDPQIGRFMTAEPFGPVRPHRLRRCALTAVRPEPDQRPGL